MATRALQVVITGDKSSLDRTLKGIDQSVDRSEGRLKKFGKAGALALGGLGVAAGAGAVGLKKVADAAIESEKSQARMITQLRASNVSYRKHADEIDRVIQKHSALSGLDDEDLQDAFTNIVRVTGDVDKGLRLTGLAADFARAKHMDVAKAGELVGKVAGGNTGILSRYGIQVEKGATATEALGLLQQKFAGQAEAYGKTTAGSLDRASVASENLQEVLGAKLTPLLAKAATAFVNLIDKSGDLAGPIRRVTGTIRDGYDSVISAVRRFTRRHEEDLQDVAQAMRNLARAARFVFEEVLVPVVKRVLPIIRDFAEGVVRHIGSMIRLTTAIINGDWAKAWDTVKDIVRNAVTTIKRVWGRIGGIILDVIEEIPGAVRDAAVAAGKAIGRGILDGAEAVITGDSGLLDTISKGFPGAEALRNFGKLVGDGIGKRIGPSMGAPGLGGGALMGADPDLGPFAAVGARFGLRVSSGIRPGAITSTGGQSYHGSGDAIDMAGHPGGMLQTFRFLKQNFGSRLRELIYTPGGVGIKDGRPYTYSGTVAQDHYDHVHVAYTGPFGDGIGQAVQAAKAAGFRGQALVNAVAIAGAESRYDAEIVNPNYPDYSVGLWQINMLAHGNRFGTEQQLKNPLTNARAAFKLSSGGRNWGPWSTWPAAAREYLSRARAAVSGGGAPGASGGGRGAARNVRIGTSGGTVGAGGPDIAGSFRGGLGADAEVEAGTLAVRRAKAERKDDLNELIGVMEDERTVKRRRLKVIRRALRGRMSRKRRARLLEEEAALISEIGDLTAGIKEYKADQAGGATTITRADELDAGVAPDTGDTGGAGSTGGGADTSASDALAQQLLAVQQEIAANQRAIIRLVSQQGPALVGAVVAAANGGIAGNVGLGFSVPGYAGSVARY